MTLAKGDKVTLTEQAALRLGAKYGVVNQQPLHRSNFVSVALDKQLPFRYGGDGNWVVVLHVDDILTTESFTPEGK